MTNTPSSEDHRTVAWLRSELKLDTDIHYSLGLIRVSARDRQKLSDNEDTGANVFRHLEDYDALSALPSSITERGWLPVRYCDVDPLSTSSTFGWIGVIGKTIFVAVADSAIEANLTPAHSDPARTGLNAFSVLVVAAGLAGQIDNMYAPFRSRWWRSDLWGNWVLNGLQTRLPNLVIWDGARPLSEGVAGAVDGATATSNAKEFAEQVFEKSDQHRRNGLWPRPSRELPLGLRRKRKDRGEEGLTLTKEVEVDTRWRPVAADALEMLAIGKTYLEIGALLAEKGAPMRGPNGAGKTFADHSSTAARTAGVKALFSAVKLQYYQTGEVTVRSTTKLKQDKIREIPLEFDASTGRRYVDRTITFPHTEFLSAAQWAEVHERLDKEAASRATGAAAQRKGPGMKHAALQGVRPWTQSNGRQGKLASETPTSYRWRERDPVDRGWATFEGTSVATLRRQLFDHALGRALLDRLQSIDEPIAVLTNSIDSGDASERLNERIVTATHQLQQQREMSATADREVVRAGSDDDEADHWRNSGRQARAEVRRLEDQVERLRTELKEVEELIVVDEETVDADVTLPGLVGSLLLDGSGQVEAVVTEGLRRLGITDTLQLRLEDNGTTVRATAVASIPLEDGVEHPLQLSWTCPNSINTSGIGPIVPAMIRAWATGLDLDDVSRRYPSVDSHIVSRHLRARLERSGVASRGLRTALLECPIVAVRCAAASIILDDAALCAGLDTAFVQHVRDSYFQRSRWGGRWCDDTFTSDVRRILSVLAQRSETWEDGMDVSVVSTHTGIPAQRIRSIGRTTGAFVRRDHRRVRLLRCTQPHCSQHALDLYLPAPEVPGGVVCPSCWRPSSHDVKLRPEHLLPWQFIGDGKYVEAAPADVGRIELARDQLLPIKEVAERLGVTTTTVRRLDAAGHLTPTRHAAGSGERLYSPGSLAQIPADVIAGYRRRSIDRHKALNPGAEKLVNTSGAARILGLESAKQVRRLANFGVIDVALETTSGRRFFDPDYLAGLDNACIAAMRLTSLGDLAAGAGLSQPTLRRLAETGEVHGHRTRGGTWRFDAEPTRNRLAELGFLGSATDPIVAIGVLAEHPEVRLSQSIIRQLCDEGLIAVSARIGGKRRFLLSTALDDVRNARTSGRIPQLA